MRRWVMLVGVVMAGCESQRRCEFDRNCLGGEVCVAGYCEEVGGSTAGGGSTGGAALPTRANARATYAMRLSGSASSRPSRHSSSVGFVGLELRFSAPTLAHSSTPRQLRTFR